MIETIVASGAVVVAAVAAARLFAGPTFYDRALAALGVNALLALALAAVGVMTGRLALIDQAIIQVAVGFVLGVAVLKLLRLRSLQPSLQTSPRDPEVQEGPAA